MAQITNYQCPNCTGPLHFDGGSGKLVCDYCNASLDVATVEQLYADKEQAAAATVTDPQWDVSTAGGNWSEEEAAHLRAYNCPSCGAQLICDDTTAATSCPYCGNPTVIPGQFTGQLKPDYVIPFLLDKNAAVEAMKKYYKGKKFLPKSFKSENRIEEIKGVYVPFWLFDGKTDAHIRFNAKNTKTYTSGDYEVTETDHYRVVREGQVAFEKVPADGSTKMPDAHMDAIEPFNYSELTPFSTAYLPGFLADKYDVDAEGCLERVNERFRNSTVNAFKTTTREYDSVDLEYADIQLIKGEVKYALLPVWLLSTKRKDQSFLFAMNGQTGKLVGDLPVDKGLVLAWFAGISLPLMLIIGAILFLGGF